MKIQELLIYKMIVMASNARYGMKMLKHQNIIRQGNLNLGQREKILREREDEKKNIERKTWI